ncbi:MAG: hypothetical protein HIU84_14140 [Acidobacteria bacterium]|nr:hypothetical protein [Acidobacteriota bacterium]
MLTQNELRHVLELATQKQLAAFVRLANTAGIPVTGEPTDTEKYDAETAQFTTSTPAFEVIGAPHFKFAIRPNGYDEERVEYAGLSDAVRQAAIGVRGWPYPFVQAPDLGASWVSEASTVVHKEMWVAFESGQFGSWHNIPRDSDGEYGAYPGRQVVPIWLPVTHFTEVMAFAIRYQALTAPAVPMNIDLELVGATGWTLAAGDGRRALLHGDYTLKTSHWKRTLAIPAHAKGLVDARDLAVAPSLHLLQRFGWVGANEQIIRSIQADGFGEQQL